MDTSFFILLISAALALVVVLSIYYSLKAYQIRRDLKSLKIDGKNKIVTERLRQYQATLNQYDYKVKQLNEQLSLATSKRDQKRLDKTIDQLKEQVKVIENGQRLYVKLLEDYWVEINKSDREKNPGLHKQDFENYIRHSGMQYIDKGEIKNGEQK